MANLVGVEITTKLSIYSRSGSTKAAVNADALPTVEVEKEGENWLSVGDTTVTPGDTGVYTFPWTPDEDGEYEVIWRWEYGSSSYSQVEKYVVESSIIGVSEIAEEAEEEVAVPDLGASKTCLVTGTFYDASGNLMKGVYVRFTPLRLEDSFLSSGIVAQEVTASSGEDGQISLYLIRGCFGTLSISGTGMVREVVVPDAGACDIMALAALGEDLLEVQRPQFTTLPRRS
jgi:hypothetical protein